MTGSSQMSISGAAFSKTFILQLLKVFSALIGLDQEE